MLVRFDAVPKAYSAKQESPCRAALGRVPRRRGGMGALGRGMGGLEGGTFFRDCAYPS